MVEPFRVTTQSLFNNCHVPLNAFINDDVLTRKTHLYRHQVEAVRAIRNHFLTKRTALLVLPTGTGKTGVAVLAPYICNTARVLVITPSPGISVQISENFSGPADEKNAIADKSKSFLRRSGVLPAEMEFAAIPARASVRKGPKGAIDLAELNTSERPLMILNAHRVGTNTRVKIENIPDQYDLVIVDEAHHYPADTWKLLIDRFQNANRLFLTATPYRSGDRPILVDPAARTEAEKLSFTYQNSLIAYQMSEEQAVVAGIIRRPCFRELQGDDTYKKERNQKLRNDIAIKAVIAHMKSTMEQHDKQLPSVRHQGMILSQITNPKKNNINAASRIVELYNEGLPATSRERCVMYVSDTQETVLKQFQAGEFRTIVVVGRLGEGFDHSPISTVGIIRNLRSRILFRQFMGRAVRRSPGTERDPVDAVVVSHERYGQQYMWDTHGYLPEVDIGEGDDEEDEVIPYLKQDWDLVAKQHGTEKALALLCGSTHFGERPSDPKDEDGGDDYNIAHGLLQSFLDSQNQVDRECGHDGACYYHVIAFQLQAQGYEFPPTISPFQYVKTRILDFICNLEQKRAEYLISEHPQKHRLNGVLTPESFRQWLRDVYEPPAAWADGYIIQFAHLALAINIRYINANTVRVTDFTRSIGPEARTIVICNINNQHFVATIPKAPAKAAAP